MEGGTPERTWKVWAFEILRRITVFGLGVWIIISALEEPESGNTVAMLVIGMVMVGVLPVENLVLPWTRRERRRKDADTDRD